jgi:DNA-binding YbaB/EbfC family protein
MARMSVGTHFHGRKTASWRHFPEQRRSEVDEDETFSPGGLGDFSAGGLGDLFSQLQAARADVEAQAEAVDETVVEGSAAGGAVVIRLSGSLEAESVHIDGSIVDSSDVALLEDAVLAALRDGLARIVELRNSIGASAAAGVPLGIDLGNLVGSLDFEGLLGGVDLEGLMGNLGMGMDLGAISSLGVLGDEFDADEFETGGLEPDDDVERDDEPEA